MVINKEKNFENQKIILPERICTAKTNAVTPIFNSQKAGSILFIP
jgi:hypothetical protein